MTLLYFKNYSCTLRAWFKCNDLWCKHFLCKIITVYEINNFPSSNIKNFNFGRLKALFLLHALPCSPFLFLSFSSSCLTCEHNRRAKWLFTSGELNGKYSHPLHSHHTGKWIRKTFCSLIPRSLLSLICWLVHLLPYILYVPRFPREINSCWRRRDRLEKPTHQARKTTKELACWR